MRILSPTNPQKGNAALSNNFSSAAIAWAPTDLSGLQQAETFKSTLGQTGGNETNLEFCITFQIKLTPPTPQQP
jgi:hypothetical protein